MLGIRLDPATEAGLLSIARRTKRTKSDIARDAIGLYVRRHDEAFLAEARRQSIEASRVDDAETLEMLDRMSSDLARNT